VSPWRFASKRTDHESGYVFFGRRYYSPEAGRFLTPDPTGFSDGPNLYSYVHNSPLVLIDPYGLFSIEDFYRGVSRSSTVFYNSTELRHVSYNPTSEDPSKKVETTFHQNGIISHSENVVGNVSDLILKEPHVEWLLHGEGFYKEYQGQNLKGKTTTSWNGITTTHTRARENAEMIKNIAGKACDDVLVCHNPSEGLFLDLVECAMQWLGFDT
jgi:RHS repeat-associated protein